MTIRFVVMLLYIVVGIVNFVPLIGVLGTERLESLYGVPIVGEDVSLLLRHRAVLFGLLGAFIFFAALRTQWRGVATFAGLMSMVGFAILALPIEPNNAEMQRVFWIDIGAIVLLLVAYGLSKLR
jgi:hypothetical protein